MANLYGRHLEWLENSKESLKRFKLTQNENSLDSACFNAQQSLEFLLKHILSEYAIEYRKTHNIEELLELLKKNNVKCPIFEELIPLANIITSWEENGRYGSGIRTGINTIEKVYNIINEINDWWLMQQDN